MNRWISIGIVLAAAVWMAQGQKARKMQENRSMKTVVNDLGAEIAVTAKVKSAEDLRVVLTLSNESKRPFRLNATDLRAASLIFRIVQPDGSPAPTGPPPTPEVNDGETGRTVLRPGEPLVQTFSGSQLVVAQLKPGRYTISFTYINGNEFPGEWAGSIETKPVEFEVAPDLQVLR